MNRPAKRRLLAVALAAALLMVTSLLASSGKIGAVEERILRDIYGMPGNWRLLALLITQFGSAWVLLSFCGFLLATRKLPNLSLLVLRNGTLAYLASELLKQMIARPRPAMLLADIVQRDSIQVRYGFPSGHTALATTVGLTIMPYVPRQFRWIIWAGIGAVGWSRIYLGVHAPLDVLGGFLLGALVVLLADFLPNKGLWKKEPKS